MRTESYATAATKRPETSSLSKARVHLQLMSTITTRILRTVSFLRLRRAFANAHKAIAAWIVVTATGAAAFGWATSGVPDEPPELEDRPLAGMLQPGEDTVNELNRQLPDDCHVEVARSSTSSFSLPTTRPMSSMWSRFPSMAVLQRGRRCRPRR